MDKTKRIVIPVDRSDASKLATQQGLYLAKLLGVEVSIITVNDTHQFMASAILEEHFKEENVSMLEEFKKIGESTQIPVSTYLMEGVPAEEIVKFAKEDDLIVMASRGKKGLNKFLLGSVSEEVLRRAPCSVMIIKPRMADEVPHL